MRLVPGVMDEVCERISRVKVTIPRVVLRRIPPDVMAQRGTDLHTIKQHMWASVELEVDGRKRKVALTPKAVVAAKKTKRAVDTGMSGEVVLLEKALFSLIPEARQGTATERRTRGRVLMQAAGEAWRKAAGRIDGKARTQKVLGRVRKVSRRAVRSAAMSELKPALKILVDKYEMKTELREGLWKAACRRDIVDLLDEILDEKVVQHVMDR